MNAGGLLIQELKRLKIKMNNGCTHADYFRYILNMNAAQMLKNKSRILEKSPPIFPKYDREALSDLIDWCIENEKIPG